MLAYAIVWWSQTADAAIPGKSDYISAQAAGNPVSAPPDDVVQLLSGTSFPGVIDHLLQRSAAENGAGIHINYPSLGDARIDADIRGWVTDLADAFSSHLDFTVMPGESAEDINATVDAILRGDNTSVAQQEDSLYELWGAYKVSRPSDAAVSIDFELWNYTGAPEGNLDIITLNYSLLTGQRLNFVDIFEKPDVALQLMSSWAREQLGTRLGAARRTRMLQDGTEPVIENFSSFSLTPEGICINFQPWQVAPSDAGIQKVAMPLEALMPSEPLLVLWGKGDKTDEHTGID